MTTTNAHQLTVIIVMPSGEEALVRLHVAALAWDPEWKTDDHHVEVDTRSDPGSTWHPIKQTGGTFEVRGDEE